jgi:hypothetical protein
MFWTAGAGRAGRHLHRPGTFARRPAEQREWPVLGNEIGGSRTRSQPKAAVGFLKVPYEGRPFASLLHDFASGSILRLDVGPNLADMLAPACGFRQWRVIARPPTRYFAERPSSSQAFQARSHRRPDAEGAGHPGSMDRAEARCPNTTSAVRTSRSKRKARRETEQKAAIS